MFKMNITCRNKSMYSFLGSWTYCFVTCFYISFRALAKPHIIGPFSFPTALAILLTALKSPGLAKGNPASITSTPNLAN